MKGIDHMNMIWELLEAIVIDAENFIRDTLVGRIIASICNWVLLILILVGAVAEVAVWFM